LIQARKGVKERLTGKSGKEPRIMNSGIDGLCINTIRMLSVDAVEKAASGHPGLPMGAAAPAYVLWTRFLKHNPSNPAWPDRDRFVLSAGHGSMLLYSLLFLTGYSLNLEDIKAFRQWESKTPGHPEYGITPGVETTTGPLGQGFANAVGMAIAERFLSAVFNRPGHDIIDHFTYVLASDGDLMEGISHEAASLAGHLGLGKLICLYDDNRISIEGSTDIAFSEDRVARFEAYGWHVQRVEDGNNLEAVARALDEARKEVKRPSFIAIRTRIGFGSPNKENTAAAHGEPLGPEEVRLTKERLNWPLEPSFYVPQEALDHFRRAVARGDALQREWEKGFEAYRKQYPKLADDLEAWLRGDLPPEWDSAVPSFLPQVKPMATREASGAVLNAFAKNLLNLMGGSADLAPSNKTLIKGEKDFGRDAPSGRNMRFGVREHAMGAIANGMALHGGIRPYCGTFLTFSDYMRPAIRLAALMRLKVTYIFTHDSIGLGEDGPTHQPVEQLAALRAIPGLWVIRPADANETLQAWKLALERKDGPVVMALTRQGLPILDRSQFGDAEGVKKGAYILMEPEGYPQVIIIATGSEVHLALEAAGTLKQKGIRARVVSMPSWELFEMQEPDYKEKVFPASIKARIAVEAGSPMGWAKYIGECGEFVGLERFGASAPYKVLYERFAITASEIVKRALKLVTQSS
jgi:transketolase